MSCCYGDNSHALWSITVRSTPGSKVKPTLDKQSCSILMSDLSQGLARTRTHTHTRAHTHTHTERERGLFVRLLLPLDRSTADTTPRTSRTTSFHLTFFDSIYLLIQHTFVFEISLLCSLTIYLFYQKDSKNSTLILWIIITIYKKCFLFEYMWPWTIKPVLRRWSISVVIAKNNTLYGSNCFQRLFFLLCQKSVEY